MDADEHLVETKTGEVRRQLSKEGSERAVVLSGFGKVAATLLFLTHLALSPYSNLIIFLFSGAGW